MKLPLMGLLTLLYLLGILFNMKQGLARSKMNWMPVPQNWTETQAAFQLTTNFPIQIRGVENNRLSAYANRWLIRMRQHTGLSITPFFPKTQTIDEKIALVIQAQREGKLVLGEDESYELTVGNDQIFIQAETDYGAMRGLETLFQLLASNSNGYYWPGIQVKDAPRFPWRGLMMDISRHFQLVEVIKRNLDGMVMVKLNVLHLHITDDHGCRIESKVYPQFHEQASDGQYFTQDQTQEIIQYASDKGIRVMPEFDVPGHASSWLIAMPEIGSAEGPYSLQRRSGIFDPTLDPTNEKTYLVTPLTIDSRIWPRTAAIAERFWSSRELREVEDMYRRLEVLNRQLELVGIMHIRNQEVLMRQLTNGQPTGALQVIVDVVEPMKGYTRNPEGNLYTVFSPLSLIADTAIADAHAVRAFHAAVIHFTNSGDDASKREILEFLDVWEHNHQEFIQLLAKAPELKEVENVSAVLSELARLTKKLMSGATVETSKAKMASIIEKAQLQDGRVEIQIVDSIQKLSDYYFNYVNL